MKQHKNLLTKGTLAAAVLAMVFAGTAYAADTATGTGNGVCPRNQFTSNGCYGYSSWKNCESDGKGKYGDWQTVPLRPGLIR